MASTAAWSAAFSLPWPRRRAEATAARSVTRTSSSVRMRSMILPGSTVMAACAASGMGGSLPCSAWRGGLSGSLTQQCPAVIRRTRRMDGAALEVGGAIASAKAAIRGGAGPGTLANVLPLHRLWIDIALRRFEDRLDLVPLHDRLEHLGRARGHRERFCQRVHLVEAEGAGPEPGRCRRVVDDLLGLVLQLIGRDGVVDEDLRRCGLPRGGCLAQPLQDVLRLPLGGRLVGHERIPLSS